MENVSREKVFISLKDQALRNVGAHALKIERMVGKRTIDSETLRGSQLVKTELKLEEGSNRSEDQNLDRNMLKVELVVEEGEVKRILVTAKNGDYVELECEY